MRSVLLLSIVGIACDQTDPPPAAAPLSTYTRVPKAECAALLGDQGTPVADGWRGTIGATDGVTFILASDSKVETRLSAWVFKGKKSSGQFSSEYPGIQPWAFDEVQDPVFVDADGDGLPEVVVMATWMTGMGPEGAVPFQHNTTLRWTGRALRPDIDADMKIASVTDPAKVRRLLSKH